MTGRLNVDANLKILVVDDHHLTREMVRSILVGIGFHNVYQAESGQAALESLQKRLVDLVICDWNMPNGSGIELLRSMRHAEKLKNIPFLMLTAEAYRENIQEAVKEGVSDYVAKPFTAATLAEKIQALFKQKQN